MQYKQMQTLRWACLGTPRAILGYSSGFRPPNLPTSATGDISVGVFHEQAFCMKVAQSATSTQGQAIQ